MRKAVKPEHVFVDMGYRGYDCQGEVHVDKLKCGRNARNMWRWIKRRAAIKPEIVHVKREHRVDRNQLKGKQGALQCYLKCSRNELYQALSYLTDTLRIPFAWLFNYQRALLAAQFV